MAQRFLSRLRVLSSREDDAARLGCGSGFREVARDSGLTNRRKQDIMVPSGRKDGLWLLMKKID